MARTVRDLAILLDVMVGYDPEDPITALGVGKVPATYTASLDPQGLQGARIGIIRESMGRVGAGYRRLREGRPGIRPRRWPTWRGGRDAGGPRGIPHLNELLAQRTSDDRDAASRNGTVAAATSPSSHRRRSRRRGAANAEGPVDEPNMRAFDPRRPRVPGGEGRANVQRHEGDGGPPARRHRAPDRGAPAYADPEGVNPPFVNTRA